MCLDLMDTTPVVVLLICIYYFDSVIRCGPYPQVPIRFKKKNQVKSPRPVSRTPNLVRIRQSGRTRNRGVTSWYQSLGLSVSG